MKPPRSSSLPLDPAPRDLLATRISACYRELCERSLALLAEFARAGGWPLLRDLGEHPRVASQLLVAFTQNEYALGHHSYIAKHAILGMQLPHTNLKS